MKEKQGKSGFNLQAGWVGALPIVNAILNRLHVDRLLQKTLPRNGRISSDCAIGVLLRNIILTDRQPIYSHCEWAARVESSLLGMEEEEMSLLNDDRVGRALEHLFDADIDGRIRKRRWTAGPGETHSPGDLWP